ncbi:MAG: DNA-binding protein [Marinilabiliales bacterium]|nr:MAG: DNA-binding protein [Marinilabiliales bacterium]
MESFESFFLFLFKYKFILLHDVIFRRGMNQLSKYRIVYQGLSTGKHEFEFDVDNMFFENLEYSDIEKGSLKVKLDLDKKSTFLELDFQINGVVELTCDRCLDEYIQPVNYQGKLFVKFSEKDTELADDVICLSPAENELDISHYIYESINLSIPLKRVHPEDENGESTCNPEMLEKLGNYKTDEPAEEDIDPRWEDLRNLMANNNN